MAAEDEVRYSRASTGGGTAADLRLAVQDEAMEMAGPSKAAAKTGKSKSASETYVKVRSVRT